MKIKTLFLIFPFFLFAQENIVLSKINAIENYTKECDSIANRLNEEILSGEWNVISTNSKKTKFFSPLLTFTQYTKKQNDLIRVCFRQMQKTKTEDWHVYFQNSKLVYIEIIKWRGKRDSTKKYYFEDEILISPKNFDLEKEMDIISKAKRISGK